MIIIHAVNNSLATAIYYLSDDSTLVLWKDQPFLNAAVMVIGGGLMVWLAYLQFNREEGLTPIDHHPPSIAEEEISDQTVSPTE